MKNETGLPPDKIVVMDMADAVERSEGNPGALNVLTQLKQRGDEVYNKVAPRLGRGEEIAIKFQVECEFDLDALIKKYGR